jgi:LuxR family maltose regulon positive regulatory protein
MAKKRQLQNWLQELAARPLSANTLTLSAPSTVPHTGVRVVETGETLSPREVEVLQLVIGGAGNQHIADTLVISLHTAKHHVASILQKLGVASRTQAAARGRSLGLEPIPPE